MCNISVVAFLLPPTSKSPKEAEREREGECVCASSFLWKRTRSHSARRVGIDSYLLIERAARVAWLALCMKLYDLSSPKRRRRRARRKRNIWMPFSLPGSCRCQTCCCRTQRQARSKLISNILAVYIHVKGLVGSL